MATVAQSAVAAEDAVHRILESDRSRGLLRFITCGSVDDGKSTLIGRLLYDSELIYEDQLAALVDESRNRPVTDEGLDFSLLVDGLQAEREQGITIDVAYRFFATGKRKFIVADTPGHEQYTRNMATGASTADLAVILIDARKGVLTQTRRHAFIATLLGIRHLAVVVNKMDLVGHDQSIFDAISADMRAFCAQIEAGDPVIIPISALRGENVTQSSMTMPWYSGPTLLAHLETIEIAQQDVATRPFRMPVQWVNRPFDDFRGFSGTIASGRIKPGDPLMVMGSRQIAHVSRIATFDGDLREAGPGTAVTLVLDREIDVSRGDMLTEPDQPPHLANQFQAKIVWIDEKPLMPGRSYLIRLGTDTQPASVTDLRYTIDVNTLDHGAAKTLSLNELAVVNIAADTPLAFDSYADCRETGGFILIDRTTAATVAAGMIDYPLRRATNIEWQEFDIDRGKRSELKRQMPSVVWFTGLSGSGKSTIANLVEQKLYAEGKHVYVLDGDNVRHGLNKDLGFTDADRVENIRRVGEVARLMADAGLIVLVSFISPFRSERRLAREIADDVPFIEVHVDTPLEVCEARDPKGLYAKARAGQIKNFTGIDSDYEPPESPELRVDTTTMTPEDAATRIADLIERVQPV